MPDEESNTIEDAAEQPAEVSVDGQTVKQHKLTDRLAVERHVASQEAAKKGLGVKVTKVVPPGGA